MTMEFKSKIKEGWNTYGLNYCIITANSIIQVAAFAFVLFPLLSQRLGASGFGSLMLIFSIINFCLPVFNGSLTTAFFRFSKNYEGKQKNVYRSTLFWSSTFLTSAIVALICAVIPFIESQWNDQRVTYWLPFFLIYYFFFSVNELFSAFLIMEQDYKSLLVGKILYFLTLVMSVPVYDYFVNSPWWIIVVGAGPLSSFLFLLTKSIRKGYFTLKWMDLQICKILYPIVLIYIIGHSGAWILSMGDRWLLGSYNVGMDQIAYFTVAVQASLLSIFPVEMISNLIMPFVCNFHDFKDVDKAFARKSFILMAVSVIFVATIGLFAGYLYMRIFYDFNYFLNSWSWFLVMMIGVCFYPFLVFSRPYLTRFYSPWMVFMTEMLSGVIGIGTMIYLFPKCGIMGIAIGRSAGSIVKSGIYLFTVQMPLFIAIRGDSASPLRQGRIKK